mmetsp:Transcript_24955/g.32231  ORF Transcript_24955/g.32231 Transcript_24955/m.32231 type:complete len:346 (+) Transcript_24955:104-1141(+)
MSSSWRSSFRSSGTSKFSREDSYSSETGSGSEYESDSRSSSSVSGSGSSSQYSSETGSSVSDTEHEYESSYLSYDSTDRTSSFVSSVTHERPKSLSSWRSNQQQTRGLERSVSSKASEKGSVRWSDDGSKRSMNGENSPPPREEVIHEDVVELEESLDGSSKFNAEKVTAKQPGKSSKLRNFGFSEGTQDIHLPEKDLKMLTAAFELSDEHGSGVLGKRQFTRALAAIGMHATQEQCLKWFDETDVDQDHLIDYEEFVVFYYKTIHKRLSDEEIKERFDELWSGTGEKKADEQNYIDVSDFRRIMTTYGEKLTDEEVEEMIRDCKPKGGKIFLDNYMNMLLVETT